MGGETSFNIGLIILKDSMNSRFLTNYKYGVSIEDELLNS